MYDVSTEGPVRQDPRYFADDDASWRHLEIEINHRGQRRVCGFWNLVAVFVLITTGVLYSLVVLLSG